MSAMGGKRTLLCDVLGGIINDVNKQLRFVVVLGGAALLSSCVQYGNDEPPLVVNVRSEGGDCRVTVEGKRVAGDQLLEVAKRAGNRRAIVVFARDTPYRCIGGSIFNLQRAGIPSVDAAMWDDS